MKFEGIIPALVTPLDEMERVNTKVLTELIEYQLGLGADGFYIGGATGEGIALKTEERIILAESAVKTINHRKPAIVQVAAADFNDAIILAKHAEECGADAISATPPLFFQYDEDDIYNYYKKLADAVSIPLMMYYNPATGFNFNADYAARLFEIDNITSIKWTSPNYMEMIRLKDLTKGEINIINGPDQMLLMGLSAGADGGIGTTYNFMFKTIKSVYTSFKNGDMEAALAYQTRADRIIDVLHKYKTIPATKVILEEMGFAVGNSTFPMKRYTDKERQKLISDMKNAGLEI